MTIDDGYGEVVNCVDFVHQHGYDSPPVERLTPPPLPVAVPPRPSRTLYGNVGPRCPDNTVPQLRENLSNVERYSTLDDYIRRAGPPSTYDGKRNDHASMFMDQTNYGGGAELNIQFDDNVYGGDPYMGGSDHALSQIWVTDWTSASCSTQSVEIGLGQDPTLYQDNGAYVHYFIYSTPGSYAGTPSTVAGCPATVECYNAHCADGYTANPGTLGFWGAMLDPAEMSIYGGTQTEDRFDIVRDDVGNWWVYLEGYSVGYYPLSHFQFGSQALVDGAQQVEFGGEYWTGQYSTGTGNDTHPSWGFMGNGTFPIPGGSFASMYGTTDYQRLAVYYDAPNRVAHTPLVSPSATHAACYNAAAAVDGTNGAWVMFGGTGYHAAGCN
jgi:hypothetical protein